MNAGKYRVSIGFLIAAFMAVDAGRVGESGSGAMWIAPEFVSAARISSTPCGQTASLEPRELVFETIEPGEFDAREARELTAAAREIVRFEWNPATSELRYDTAAPTAVFSDLVPFSSRAEARGLRCVSR
ncbi:MAG TPA: hypothetical protein VF033_04350 [Steroidobacteraceae bacterium]